MANITTCKTWVHPSQSTVPPQYVILGVQNAQGHGAIYVYIQLYIHIYIYNDNDDDNNSNSNNNNNNNNMNMRYTSIYFHINMPSRLAAMEHRSHPRRGCGAE